MVTCFATANSGLTSVAIAHVDEVMTDDSVITCFDFAVARRAASGSTLDRMVSRFVGVARALDIDVT
jgi:hypothetical protein